MTLDRSDTDDAVDQVDYAGHGGIDRTWLILRYISSLSSNIPLPYEVTWHHDFHMCIIFIFIILLLELVGGLSLSFVDFHFNFTLI